MAELWHYTRDGKQMDPVPLAELKRLARLGELRPSDMVWQEGMADWVRAKTVPDLFPSLGVMARDKAAPVPAKRSRPDEGADDRKSSRVKRALEIAFDEGDDDRPSKRRRSRPNQKSGMSMPVLVGLLAGGGLMVFLLILGVILVARGGGVRNNPVADAGQKVDNPAGKVADLGIPAGANVVLTYAIDLPVQGKDIRPVQLKAGNRYEFHAKARMQNGDVDLFVMNNDGRDLAGDDGLAADAFAEITASYSGLYRIEVFNAGGLNNHATVSVVDKGPSANPPTQPIKRDPPVNDPPKVNNPPKIGNPPFPKGPSLPPPTGKSILTTTGLLSSIGPRDPVKNQTFKAFNVEMAAGKTYEIRLNSPAFDAYLRLENPQNQQVAFDDDGGGYPNARIVYTCPANGTYRIIATKLPGRSGPFTLTVNEQ